MAYQINRTEVARDDLLEIWNHIASDDFQAADHVVAYIVEKYGLLAESPRSGSERFDLGENVRSLTIGKNEWRSRYLVFYRIKDRSIDIIRILEGHRDISPELFKL